MFRKIRFLSISYAVLFLLIIWILLPRSGGLGSLLMTSGFEPAASGFMWQPDLLRLFIGSDLLIGISYMVISGILLYFVYKARQDIPFSGLFLVFSTFIISCGLTHFMDVWTLWTPVYWLSGYVQLVTAVASVATAIALPMALPRALALIQNAHISEDRRQQLILANQDLQTEIAERKRVEQALRDSEEQLRQALAKERELSVLKSRFITTMSHEFRTPLAIIGSSNDLLKNHGHQMTETRKIEHRTRIQAAIETVTRLLEDILTVGKIEAGRIEFNPIPIDIAVFCQAIIEDTRLTAKSSIELVFNYAGDCVQAVLDERLLLQIFTNLLSNAIKYSPQGGTINIDLTCENQRAVLRVHDEGIGIPEDEQRRLFENFFRAKNVGMIPGTGLGLAIVHHAVQLHQGTIRVQSQIGTGTTFVVCLPLSPAYAKNACPD